MLKNNSVSILFFFCQVTVTLSVPIPHLSDASCLDLTHKMFWTAPFNNNPYLWDNYSLDDIALHGIAGRKLTELHRLNLYQELEKSVDK